MSVRVVHVASGREWRGGQRQVWFLARALERLPDIKQVVITGRDGELARRLRESGVDVRPVSWRIGLDPRVIPAILREVRGAHTVIHAHDAHAVTLAGVAAALSRKPLIATRRVDFHLRRAGFWGRADRVIAISSAVARVLTDDGIPLARIVVIHSGIDPESAPPTTPLDIRARLGLPAIAQVAVTVAALVPHKDHTTLLTAASRLAFRCNSLHWVLAGDGPRRGEIEMLRRRLGLEGRVHLLGAIPDPPALIAEADVLVVSSREEGLGTSVLDALALGIPVASTDAGGLPEMLGDGAGLLVPSRNPEALAEAVFRILTDPALTAQLVARGASVVQRFSAQRMAEEVASVYRSSASSL